MTEVRHGLMLVGPAGGGKTMCYRSLRIAQTSLAKKGSTHYKKTKCVVLNPKSITMGQLYGDFDDATHEWTDGVLACYMRDLSEEQNLDKKWMMFDGAYFPPNTFRLCDCPNTRLTLSFLSGQARWTRFGSKT
jgi:dynein heavy chain